MEAGDVIGNDKDVCLGGECGGSYVCVWETHAGKPWLSVLVQNCVSLGVCTNKPMTDSSKLKHLLSSYFPPSCPLSPLLSLSWPLSVLTPHRYRIQSIFGLVYLHYCVSQYENQSIKQRNFQMYATHKKLSKNGIILTNVGFGNWLQLVCTVFVKVLFDIVFLKPLKSFCCSRQAAKTCRATPGLTQFWTITLIPAEFWV